MTPEEKAEEDKLFRMINACCKKILQMVEGDKTIDYLSTKKRQIVPNNYPEIIARCREILPPNQLVILEKCKETIDRCIGIVIGRYMDWGLAMGEKTRYRFGVDTIEAQSSAVMGLYRAAFTYKPGNGFANYAPFWITQVIQKSIDSRMFVTLDCSLGEDQRGETVKDQIPDSSYLSEPFAIVEDKQISSLYKKLLSQLPVEERGEIDDWWKSDSDITPNIKRFANHMYAHM